MKTWIISKARYSRRQICWDISRP